jgi:hypothetical protein
MNADQSALSAYAVFLFPFLVIALWILVTSVVGIMSGWHALARRFRTDSKTYGETRTAGPFFYSVYMRFWGHYSSVIRMTAAQDALYLSVLFLFRAGHPPLRFPWSEIRFGETTSFWKTYIELTLGNEEQIPMRISRRMARKLGIPERFTIDSLATR